MNRTINNVLLYSIIATVYAALFVPLVVSTSLYFPFITGKANVLRFLIELGFALYIVLVIRDRSYLPKKGLLMWATGIFTAVLGIATLLAEDPARSFWSNFERMEGYVTILHLYALFIVASSVIKTRQAWLALLNTSLAASIIVGLQAFGDYRRATEGQTVRIAGTLGNSSYLGVYALLHMFISGFLIANILKAKKFLEAPIKIIAYGAVILFNGIVLFNTGTRGSFVGLVVGLFLAALLLALLDKQHKLYRKVGLGVLGVVVILVALLGTFKNSAFVQNSDLISRFSSLITLDVKSVFETQGRARTMLWLMAAQGVAERPFFGWGQDNFGYVFAKYYNPQMYDQEQWFDRTHNVFFDWLIAGGVFGLLGYLSLFVAALLMIWRRPRVSVGEDEWSLAEKAILTGLMAAYFVHNLFVFDNLSSYIIFFLFLAYVQQRHSSMTMQQSDRVPLVQNPYVQGVIAIAVIVAFIFTSRTVVFKPYFQGKTLIQALSNTAPTNAAGVTQQGAMDPLTRLELFKKTLAYNSAGDTESRERLFDVSSNILVSTQDQNVINAYYEYTKAQAEQQLKETPNDARANIFYALYLQKLGLYDESLTYVDKAMSLSPAKQTFIFQRGVTEIAQKKYAEAVATFKKAYDLAPANPEARVLYAVALVYADKFAEAKKVIGTDMTAMSDARLLQAYAEKNRYGEIVEIAKMKLETDPNNPQFHMSLAGAYLKMGKRADAIASIRKVIELAPDFKETGEFYIKEIQAGRDPSRAQ